MPRFSTNTFPTLTPAAQMKLAQNETRLERGDIGWLDSYSYAEWVLSTQKPCATRSESDITNSLLLARRRLSQIMTGHGPLHRMDDLVGTR